MLEHPPAFASMQGNALLDRYEINHKALSNIKIGATGNAPDYNDHTPNQFGHDMSMASLAIHSGLDIAIARLGALAHEFPGNAPRQSAVDVKASLVAIQFATDVKNGKIPVEQWGDEWRKRFGQPFLNQANLLDKTTVEAFRGIKKLFPP
ncbi:MAG: hypothetical protein ACKO37_05795 [Vampirovibrionales bacterium]